MKRKHWTAWTTILAIMVFSFSLFLCDYAVAKKPAAKAAAGEKKEALQIKGKVKGISNKAKTISVSVTGKGVMIFKFNDATEVVNAKAVKKIKKGEAVIVKYKAVGPDKVASFIKRALVKLPKGVVEIKTSETAALVSKGPKAGNYYLVDARPAKIYAMGHIPTAVSIPVPKLKKKGAKLLPADKNITLIFYCGGPT